MAVIAPPMTYEDYLTEEVSYERYDIIDGVRILMANPTRRHQRTQGNLYISFRDYETVSGRGEVIQAPCDVLIRRSPLRTRQPDLLLISREQLAKNAGENDPAPLEYAPELVVEILSPSETSRGRHEKILDYCSVGVRECWIVDSSVRTVELLNLNPDGYELVAIFGVGETVHSITFPGLAVPVDAIFAG